MIRALPRGQANTQTKAVLRVIRTEVPAASVDDRGCPRSLLSFPQQPSGFHIVPTARVLLCSPSWLPLCPSVLVPCPAVRVRSGCHQPRPAPPQLRGTTRVRITLPQCIPSAHSSAAPRVLSLLCTPFSTQIHLELCFYFASSFSHPSFPHPSFPLPTSPSLPLTPSSLFFSFPTFSSYHNPLPLVSWV